MTFIKSPGKDPAQVAGEVTVEGLGDVRAEGAIVKSDEALGVVKAGVGTAATVKATIQGGIPAIREMAVGAATEKATQAIESKIDGITGRIPSPGFGLGVAARVGSMSLPDVSGDIGGVVSGKIAGTLGDVELPIFEEKAITSFTPGKIAGPFQARAGAIWDEGTFAGARADSSGISGGSAPSSTDFMFAWEDAAGPGGPWSHLRIVAFRGTEALSSLYRYEIIALAREPAAEIDPDELIEKRATLRIATLTEPAYRVVHGIIIEAEEMGPVQGGILYRIVLAPPLARAMHRTRCRIFLEKTTRQIIDAVLQGDPLLQRADGATAPPDEGDDTSFAPAKEVFTWHVADGARIDDVATRSYCVQYNESDFAFLSRLLEEEGISYHFENGERMCQLVLTDKDLGRARLDPSAPLGPGIPGRAISVVKLGARLRPRKVSLVDYNWKQPTLDMNVAEPARPSNADLVDHEYPGRYTETPAMGKPIASAKLERLEVEASYAVGEGTCRTVTAGSIFTLEHPQARYEGEYLVTKLEVRGEQQGALPPGAGAGLPMGGVPYAATFECARRGKNGVIAESRFRPARVTPRPRIHGSQTAFVTAEPSTQGAEIHVGGPKGAEIGCVRVKFHWDQEATRHAKEPTSCWVRVNQVFAGVGEGAVFHPRVGVEVIVDFEEGDPDRPIIVGRVYNGRNRPPGGAKTVSTFKTMSSPATGAFNELTFDDTAGKEQIKMHTPYNWDSHAGNDRSEKVANNSGSNVGTDRNEVTGSNRSTMAGGNNAEVVAGSESVTVGVNQTVTVGGNQTVAVTGAQTETVSTGRTTDITAKDKLTVTGTQDLEVTGAQTTKYDATHDLTVTGKQTVKVGGEQSMEVTGPQGLKSTTSQKIEAPEQTIAAEGLQKLTSTVLDVKATGLAKIETAMILVNGGGLANVDAAAIVLNAGGPVTITGGTITITGGKVTIKGSPVEMDGGAEVSVKGGVIKLN